MTTDQARTKSGGPPADEVEVFAGFVAEQLASAWAAVSVHLGVRLGLYGALVEGPGHPHDIALRAGTHPRLTHEWLDGQVVNGIVTVDGDRYALPAAHAAVLAAEHSPAYLGAAGGVLSAVIQGEDRIVAAFRGDGRLAWDDQPACLSGAVDRFYRNGYEHRLVNDWLPRTQRGVADLTAGGRLADVGCGHGSALVVLADAFPDATFVGIDPHSESLRHASERIADADLDGRIRLDRQDAASFGGGPFDLICFLDSLHDMGDPDAAIRNARGQLAPTGSILLVEPATRETLPERVGDLAARIYYPGSAFLCTPNALAQGDDALGNQVPEATWKQRFLAQGFGEFRRIADTPFNRVFEARL